MTAAENNVVAFLLRDRAADHVALLTPNQSYTYGELESAAARVAGHFLRLGCSKGDRVILISDNSFFWVAAYLGIVRAGLVGVPVPANVAEEELRFIVAGTEAKAAAAQAQAVGRLGRHFAGMHLLTDQAVSSVEGALSQATLTDLDRALEEAPIQAVDGHDLAALMFTSGSTGKPRGVMVSHGNIIANTSSIVEYLHLTGADRVMTVLPFHYCFGTSLLHSHLRVGASLYLDSRFLYPEKILQGILDAKCTGFAGVPSHFQILLRKSSLRKKSFPQLRYVQQAGGHLAPVFIQELMQALPGTQIFIMYGQTEATARLSYLPPDVLEEKLGSIGRGIPGVTLSVVHESGRPVRPGEIGEIVARGDNVTLGYWNEPEETAARFRDGALYTGDIATVDVDGFIFIVDRAEDFLKCGGKRIGSRQVEEMLQGLDCVIESAVIAVPDDVLGEAVKAFVVARMPLCPDLGDCLRDYCKKRLPPQLVPKEVKIVDSLPKNSAGKVLKTKLREL